MLKNALNTIGLNAEEIRIYIELLESGASTAGELAKRTGLVRPTVYNYLQRMTDKGVVLRSLRQGIRTFTAQSPDNLDKLFAARLDEISTQREIFKTQIPTLLGKYRSRTLAPSIQIFEGDGIKNIFNDILNYRDINSYSFWPVKSMLNILSYEYWEWNNRERVKNNVWIYAIRSETELLKRDEEAPFTAPTKELLREARIAPKGVDTTMGYWIYGNKVAMLTSAKEKMGYIIESDDMTQMMLAQWKFLWTHSKASTRD